MVMTGFDYIIPRILRLLFRIMSTLMSHVISLTLVGLILHHRIFSKETMFLDKSAGVHRIFLVVVALIVKAEFLFTTSPWSLVWLLLICVRIIIVAICPLTSIFMHHFLNR